MSNAFNFNIGPIFVGVDLGDPGYDKTGVVVAERTSNYITKVLFCNIGDDPEKMVRESDLDPRLKRRVLEGIREVMKNDA